MSSSGLFACILYRHLDKDGKLLYVGITEKFYCRLSAHQYKAKWFDQVETITIKRFETREEIIAEEKRIILEEKPPYNLPQVRMSKRWKL
jgi:predicted GIY-YIG superfamily endonuclease